MLLSRLVTVLRLYYDVQLPHTHTHTHTDTHTHTHTHPPARSHTHAFTVEDQLSSPIWMLFVPDC